MTIKLQTSFLTHQCHPETFKLVKRRLHYQTDYMRIYCLCSHLKVSFMVKQLKYFAKLPFWGSKFSRIEQRQ